MIIIINGHNGSGKDSFINLLNENYQVLNISTIDVTKNIMKEYSTWCGQKDDETRYLMYQLNEIFWKSKYDFIIKYLNERINSVQNFDICFIHCREPKNIEKLKNYFQKDFFVKTMLINRKFLNIANNPSDLNVNDYKYDFIIDNNSTLDDLKTKGNILFSIIKY